MDTSNWINFGLLVVTVLGFVIAVSTLKRDNRKSNQETIEKTINTALDEQRAYYELKIKVEKLEVQININDTNTARELRDVKQMIIKHIDLHKEG